MLHGRQPRDPEGTTVPQPQLQLEARQEGAPFNSREAHDKGALRQALEGIGLEAVALGERLLQGATTQQPAQQELKLRALQSQQSGRRQRARLRSGNRAGGRRQAAAGCIGLTAPEQPVALTAEGQAALLQAAGQGCQGTQQRGEASSTPIDRITPLQLLSATPLEAAQGRAIEAQLRLKFVAHQWVRGHQGQLLKAEGVLRQGRLGGDLKHQDRTG